MYQFTVFCAGFSTENFPTFRNCGAGVVRRVWYTPGMEHEAQMIQQWREGMGVNRLSALAGLRKETVIKILDGRCEPTLESMEKIAAVFGARVMIEREEIRTRRISRHRPQAMPELLRSMRVKAGLTQIDLETKTGVGQTLISDYEVGKHAPSFSQARRLAKPCGYSIRATFVRVS